MNKQLVKPILVIVKETEEGYEPLWQGGRTTSHAVRSFDDGGAARKSLHYLRGQQGFGSELKILDVVNYQVIEEE